MREEVEPVCMKLVCVNVVILDTEYFCNTNICNNVNIRIWSHCWCLHVVSFYTLKSADQEQSYNIWWGSGIAYLGTTIYRHMEVEIDQDLATHTNRRMMGLPHDSVQSPNTAMPATHTHIGQMDPLMCVSDFLTDLNISYHWPGASLASSDDWSLCVTQDWSQVRWLDMVPNMLPYAFPHNPKN